MIIGTGITMLLSDPGVEIELRTPEVESALTQRIAIKLYQERCYPVGPLAWVEPVWFKRVRVWDEQEELWGSGLMAVDRAEATHVKLQMETQALPYPE